MFELFKKRESRIVVSEETIFIDNQNKNIGKSIEIDFIFEFSQKFPEIKVFENKRLVRLFKIETLKSNPNLAGQFLHSSIRILPNSAVMIDGIISKSKAHCPTWTDNNYEAIRLQPFYLSNADDYNLQLVGKGLFERGLHFTGTITPLGVRNICICDSCKQSFTIQHFHAGFSEVQYFYSSDSNETLIVPYSGVENLPVQLQEDIDDDVLISVETKLPKPSNYDSVFKYYNSFRCPHCLTPYIDFEHNKAIRPKEYYGNVYINGEPVTLTHST